MTKASLTSPHQEHHLRHVEARAGRVRAIAERIAELESDLEISGVLKRKARTPEETLRDAASPGPGPTLDEFSRSLTFFHRNDARASRVVTHMLDLVDEIDRLDRALADYNKLYAQEPMSLSSAMRQIVERTRAAIEVVPDARAAHAGPRLARDAEIVLAEIRNDAWHRAEELLGDLRAIVLQGAATRGLNIVSGADVVEILRATADPERNPGFVERARQRAFRDHSEVAFEAARESERHGRTREADERMSGILNGFSQQNVQQLRDFLGDSGTVLDALSRASGRDRDAAEALRGALENELDRARTLEGEARSQLLKLLKKHIDGLASERETLEPFRRALTGEDAAIGELKRIIRASALDTVGLTTSKTTPAGALRIPMPEPTLATVLHWSGSNPIGVAFRKMMGGSIPLYDMVRARTYAVTRRATPQPDRTQPHQRGYERRVPTGEPIKFLELTHGLPMSALAWTDPGALRSLGDMFLCGTIPGTKDRSFDLAQPPPTHATVITPNDLMKRYLAGDVPPEFLTWFDRDLAGTLTPQDRAPTKVALSNGYDTLKASRKYAVHEGDAVDTLRALVARGERFDLVMCPELDWTADRVHLLELLQACLKPGGYAWVTLGNWLPKGGEGDGVTETQRIADRVRLKSGAQMPLEEYLTALHPNHFEIAHYPGRKTLLIKGTAEPVRLPKMDAVPHAAQTEYGFPSMCWFET